MSLKLEVWFHQLEGYPVSTRYDASGYKDIPTIPLHKAPMYLAIQNTIIKRWAQDNAKKAVWGTNKDLLLEFAYNEEGVVSS